MIYTLTAIFFFFLSLFVWNFRIIDYGGICKSKSFRKKKILTASLSVSCFWLILHDGLRWEIGTDWDSYYEFFQEGENLHMSDFGFLWLNQLSHFVSSKYTILLLIIATITYSIIYKFFIRWSVNPLMSLCIYYCSMLGTLGCNRQLLAMAICLLSLQFVCLRRCLPFILIVICAMLFHKTAILFMPVYWLYEHKYSNKHAYIIVLISFVIGVSRLINHLPFVNYLAMVDSMSSGTDFSSYLDSMSGSVSLVGSFKRILFASLAIAVRYKIKSKSYDFLLLMYLIGCCIYLLFNGSVLQLMAGRGALYYSIFECITIPFLINKFPITGINKKLIWFAFFLMYFFLMWRDMNSYIPSVGYDIYNPYKCVIFQ